MRSIIDVATPECYIYNIVVSSNKIQILMSKNVEEKKMTDNIKKLYNSSQWEFCIELPENEKIDFKGWIIHIQFLTEKNQICFTVGENSDFFDKETGRLKKNYCQEFFNESLVFEALLHFQIKEEFFE